MSDQTGSGRGERRLNSWKEIAAFFGKDERTVKRWETARGLPVRRVPGGTRTSVFAYVDELEAWLSAPRAASTNLAGRAQPRPVRGRYLLPAATAAALLAFSGLGLVTNNARNIAQQATQLPPPVETLYREAVIAWNNRTAAGFDTAIAKFNEVLLLAPDYAPAYAGLANAYNLVSQYTQAPRDQSYSKARDAAERALALDPNSADAYAALAFNLFNAKHQFARSAELFEKSLALAPDSPQTLHWYALTSMQMGRFERPLQLIERALALQPETRSIRANAALIRYYSGQVQPAIEMLEQLRQANPDYLAVPAYLATIYLDLGRYSDFLDNYETAAPVESSTGRQLVARAARAALPKGGRAMLTAMLAEQQQQFQAERELAYKVAATAALLGDNQLALDYLEISVDRAETLGLAIEPEFRSLRQEPRFVALLQKLGLPTN